jgi:hypothetical protein
MEFEQATTACLDNCTLAKSYDALIERDRRALDDAGDAPLALAITGRIAARRALAAAARYQQHAAVLIYFAPRDPARARLDFALGRMDAIAKGLATTVAASVRPGSRDAEAFPRHIAALEGARRAAEPHAVVCAAVCERMPATTKPKK